MVMFSNGNPVTWHHRLRHMMYIGVLPQLAAAFTKLLLILLLQQQPRPGCWLQALEGALSGLMECTVGIICTGGDKL
jgi:hypothetical protein